MVPHSTRFLCPISVLFSSICWLDITVHAANGMSLGVVVLVQCGLVDWCGYAGASWAGVAVLV